MNNYNCKLGLYTWHPGYGPSNTFFHFHWMLKLGYNFVCDWGWRRYPIFLIASILPGSTNAIPSKRPLVKITHCMVIQYHPKRLYLHWWWSVKWQPLQNRNSGCCQLGFCRITISDIKKSVQHRGRIFPPCRFGEPVGRIVKKWQRDAIILDFAEKSIIKSVMYFALTSQSCFQPNMLENLLGLMSSQMVETWQWISEIG